MIYVGLKFCLTIYFFAAYNAKIKNVNAESSENLTTTATIFMENPTRITNVTTEKPRSMDEMVQQKVLEIVKNPVNVDMKKLPTNVIEKIAEGVVTTKPPKSVEEIEGGSTENRTEITTQICEAKEMILVFPEKNKTRQEKVMKVDVFIVYPDKTEIEKYEQRNKREGESRNKNHEHTTRRSYGDRKKHVQMTEEPTTTEPAIGTTRRHYDHRMKRPSVRRPIVVPPSANRPKTSSHLPEGHDSENLDKTNSTATESTTKSPHHRKYSRRPPSLRKKPEVTTVRIPNVRSTATYKYRKHSHTANVRKLEEDSKEILENGEDSGSDDAESEKKTGSGDSGVYSQIQPLNGDEEED